MRILQYLPRTIEANGITFERYSDVSSIKEGIKQCKEDKLKYRVVKVLHKNLRGRTNLHGNLYKPTEWIFREKKTQEG